MTITTIFLVIFKRQMPLKIISLKKVKPSSLKDHEMVPYNTLII